MGYCHVQMDLLVGLRVLLQFQTSEMLPKMDGRGLEKGKDWGGERERTGRSSDAL